MYKIVVRNKTDLHDLEFVSNQNVPIPVSGMPTMGTFTTIDGEIITISDANTVDITATPIPESESSIKIDFAN